VPSWLRSIVTVLDSYWCSIYKASLRYLHDESGSHMFDGCSPAASVMPSDLLCMGMWPRGGGGHQRAWAYVGFGLAWKGAI
jgi:hypothetical protein